MELFGFSTGPVDNFVEKYQSKHIKSLINEGLCPWRKIYAGNIVNRNNALQNTPAHPATTSQVAECQAHHVHKLMLYAATQQFLFPSDPTAPPEGEQETLGAARRVSHERPQGRAAPSPPPEGVK
jgi:hypothetical protein